ncbi:endonuclease SmrB [Enterovibrio nigricans]|uniref:Ribosome rescue factor SmrB n=1 Tax=Enterovibrio nigricans DSM 22720 TaxID=1121868 RepID=A0A1T4U7U6_9GAMM|nr:endonuclease SmrB [Enterovibrio nigricans]PKF51763.1 endonuclease SmrB [Enterovibrio nigricans]SKA48696.1 DNA-nicking endonuclease, Smr domain [Enterovibrio nigricans DSM 22720]
MSKNTPIPDDEFSLFRDAVKGVKKLQQDTITPPRRQTTEQSKKKLSDSAVRDHTFYFSDEFEPLLKEGGPTQYARTGVSKYEVKRLRRGVYVPDMFLDLHGMTQMEAKRELGALIAACIKEDISCACVMHGIGKHILKQKTPLWLAQHPDVLAFHQAPLEFGGDGALLVLIEIPEK